MPDTLQSTTPRVRVHGLECRRGERTLFEAIDFAARPGEIVWIRGANGQGKTTLLRTLAGLSVPSAGGVVWQAPTTGLPFIYIGHANALKDDLTVAESLRFLASLSGAAPSRDELDAALALFGLASRRQAPVRTLSQGQRRRVALARLAALREPRTWLLDEPFDALDTAGCETLNALIVEHANRGGSTVLTSHVPFAIADPMPLIVVLESPLVA